MRLNIKKVSAIAASVLMTGLTMGTAMAANYPAPFVVSGTADVAITYGTGAGVSSLDLVQAGNIQSNLQSKMSGTSTSTTVTGGDSKVLATSARSLYYNDAINAAYSSLSYTELGSVLADGKFVDLSGTNYGYTQSVKVGNSPVAFGTSGGDLDDPALYLDASSSQNFYNYTLSFTKNVNVSDATNVQGQKLKILGIDYVIGSGSTNTTLYLYGSGETATVLGGEVKSVTIAGVAHTVELVSTSTSGATLKVDGVSKSVVKGSNYAFAGGLNVYVKDIIHPAYAGDVRQAELILGANTLKLVNAQTVKKGADETSIKGTLATISGADSTGISGFTVQITAPKSQEDSIAIGQSFTDPVFGGLKLTFASVNPSLDSSARGKILVNTNDADIGYVTFTSARAGSAGEQKLQYVYDNSTASTTVQPLLAHTTQPSSNGKGIIHVLENENAKINDWIVVNAGDAGTILEVTDMSVDTGSSGSVTLTDAITGESQKVTLTNSTGTYVETYMKTGVNIFGGTGYTISMNNVGTSMNITWGGTNVTKTLFPRIKLANGGWIAFLASTTIVNGTSVIFPDGLTTLATSGNVVTNSTFSAVYGGINWTFAGGATNNVVTGLGGTGACNFNSSQGPAILYLEPKKWDDGSSGNYICMPLKTVGALEIGVEDPVMNGTNSGFTTLESDTYVKKAVDKFGTLLTKEDRTNSNGVVTLSFPSSQMNAEVVFSAEAATVTGGSTSGASQLGDVLVKDSEVSSVSSKNLIVVGGSCINSVAANVLGGAVCSADFTTKTGIGSGQFLIQSFASPYASNKVVLLVSGYEAADTVNAATYLRTQTVDTTVGKKYQGTSATTATLVTTTA
jgi:hypothetical protein